jgi:hypothetical protein
MKRFLFVLACLMLVGGWTAWPWDAAPYDTILLRSNVDLRLAAVDAAHTPTLQTVWKVQPASAGRVVLDQPLGWTAVFFPTPDKETRCQVWAKTGAMQWRRVNIRVVLPMQHFTIAPGESWVHGSR